jgi:cytochrome bd ubiquinol oxidase subunit I
VLFRNKALDPKLTRLYWLVALWTLAFPLIANSWGWIFTEMGRQPWVVYGLLKTDAAGSPSVSAAFVLVTLIGFTLIYSVLAVVDVVLLARFGKAGPEAVEPVHAY